MLRQAVALGVWLASTVTCFGACIMEERQACGGFDCGFGQCCAQSCAGTDRSDTCFDSNGACPTIFAPVCGCDGRTYGNACEAHGACVAVAHEAACEECTYGQQSHRVGDSFPSDDGCAACTCTEGGAVVCQAAGCSVGCEHGGLLVPLGDRVAAGDGCNDCTCTEGGFACTEVGCACDPAAEFGRSYAAHSVEECAVVDFSCTEPTVPFSNACGCGCQQPLWCPQYFDCMPSPGMGCDADALAQLCPYSMFAL